VKLYLELLGKSVTKSMPTISQGYLGTPKGDSDEEPCLLGLARLQKTQLEQSALQPKDIRSRQIYFSNVANNLLQLRWPSLS